MLPFFSFGVTGLLLGCMVAFSSDHLSRVLIPLIFSLFGGSLATFGGSLSEPLRRDAYKGILALSSFCLVGIVVGILAVQFRWLTPESQVGMGGPTASGNLENTGYYLRGESLTTIRGIEARVRQRQLDKAAAYDQIIGTVDPDSR